MGIHFVVIVTFSFHSHGSMGSVSCLLYNRGGMHVLLQEHERIKRSGESGKMSRKSL